MGKLVMILVCCFCALGLSAQTVQDLTKQSQNTTARPANYVVVAPVAAIPVSQAQPNPDHQVVINGTETHSQNRVVVAPVAAIPVSAYTSDPSAKQVVTTGQEPPSSRQMVIVPAVNAIPIQGDGSSGGK